MDSGNCDRVEVQCPGVIKKWVGDKAIPCDAIETAVDVRDDMNVTTGDVDHAGECSVALEKEMHLPVIASMHEGGCHWSNNEVSGNMYPGVIKKWVGGKVIACNAVDVRNDMILTTGELDGADEFAVAPEKDVHLPAVASEQEGGCHWSGNEDSSNMDHLKGGELCLPLNKEVYDKDKCGVHIPGDGGQLGGDVSEGQGHSQRQDGAGKDAGGNHLHTCQICSQEFAEYALLRAHVMCIHLKRGRPFRCDVCSKAFDRQSDLDEHVESVHAVENKHQCEHCSRHFKYANDLRVHMSTHTGQRLYKCASCSKCFVHRSILERHMLTHTGERAYKCEICQKAFTLKHHLKEHAFTHAPLMPH